jgi:hypothetical protein
VTRARVTKANNHEREGERNYIASHVGRPENTPLPLQQQAARVDELEYFDFSTNVLAKDCAREVGLSECGPKPFLFEVRSRFLIEKSIPTAL